MKEKVVQKNHAWNWRLARMIIVLGVCYWVYFVLLGDKP